MDEHECYAPLLGQKLSIPMQEGGILLFDSLLFHAVGENRTTGTRLSLTFAYHSVDELMDRKRKGAHRVLVRGERLYRGNDIESSVKATDSEAHPKPHRAQG